MNLRASLSIYPYKFKDKKDKSGRKEGKKRNCVDTVILSDICTLEEQISTFEESTRRDCSPFLRGTQAECYRSPVFPLWQGYTCPPSDLDWASVKSGPKPESTSSQSLLVLCILSATEQCREKHLHVSSAVHPTRGNSFKSSPAGFVPAGTIPKVTGYTSKPSCSCPESLFTAGLRFCCLVEGPQEISEILRLSHTPHHLHMNPWEWT